MSLAVGEEVIREGVFFSPPQELELVAESHSVIMTLNLDRTLRLLTEMTKVIAKANTYTPSDHLFAEKFRAQLEPL